MRARKPHSSPAPSTHHAAQHSQPDHARLRRPQAAMAKGEDLYEMLGLDKSASQAEIKKAYYKLALQWHPDRNSAPEATAKFQALQRIYDVLSDPAKRQLYDRTGSLQDCEDMVQGDSFDELYAAFRAAVQVTEEDIDSFAASYRGSTEERADLLRHYRQLGGNMAKVFDWLMLSRPELDSHRFRDTLQAAITAGEIGATKAYKAWAAKVAATPAPSSDPLAPPPKQRGDNQQALVAAIKNKQTSFNGMLAALEAKYATGGGSQGSKKAAAKGISSSAGSKRARRGKGSSSKAAAAAAAGDDDDGDENQGPEPTEDEFAAARARLEQRQKAAAAAESGGGGSQGGKTAAGRSKAAATTSGKAPKKRKS